MRHTTTATSKRRQTIKGFSFIEVMIVIVIVGILATIAITKFIQYRAQSIDMQMYSDLRNAAVAVEAYYAKQSVLPASIEEIAGVGFHPTDGVTLTLAVIPPRAFTVTAAKAGGTQEFFTFDSSSGKIQ